ncbi:uridylate kinase [Scheffersomyces xylosifermentans]|uniref:uridylate kinase n=1 Tax=Scheffersomyces xylosifermentans TaxID=1304137 RepID=UPI00315DD047
MVVRYSNLQVSATKLISGRLSRPTSRSTTVSRAIRSIRLNSTKSSTPPPPPPPQNNIKGKILLTIGALAIGSTIAASVFNKEGPKSAVEPITKKERAFPDGKIKVIFVLGGPGSGKGTQSALLVKEHGFVHLSAGDLLREEQKREGSKYGELIAQYIKDGLIVPQEVTIALLEQAILKNYNKGATKFLIDGFPRKMDQALTFEEQIATSSFTLFFECPEKVMLDRLLQRGKTSGRADDNIESITKRFRTFIDTSMPVVDHFDKQGKVIKVSCDQPVEVVYDQVKKALSEKGVN